MTTKQSAVLDKLYDELTSDGYYVHKHTAPFTSETRELLLLTSASALDKEYGNTYGVYHIAGETTGLCLYNYASGPKEDVNGQSPTSLVTLLKSDSERFKTCTALSTEIEDWKNKRRD